MRLFNRGETPEDAAEKPPADETTEPSEEPEAPAEQTATEESEQVVYDESGQPLFENEDGTPYDPEGRLQPPAAEPEPEKPKPQEWRSPFAGGVLTDEERAQAESLIDPSVMPLIETIAARIADRVVASREQTRLVARDAGVPEGLTARLGAYEQYVPQEQRGTKQGAITAALMAVGMEAHESGDLEAAIRKYFTPAQEEHSPPARQPETPIPPSARMTSPRPNPDAGRSPGRPQPKDEATRSFAKDGIDADALAIMRAERKSHAIR